MQLLTRGAIPLLAGGLERDVLPDQHRSRVFATFDRLGQLAAERTRRARSSSSRHVLAPHMPVAFAADGSAVEPLPCFPTCVLALRLRGRLRRRVRSADGDQIAWLNATVAATVRTIQANSERPPVIVLFSDHGLRNDPDDHEEMFRSLFLAATPGRADVFPEDMAPVNILTRLLNSYAGADLKVASQESYWLDTRIIDVMKAFSGSHRCSIRWPTKAPRNREQARPRDLDAMSVTASDNARSRRAAWGTSFGHAASLAPPNVARSPHGIVKRLVAGIAHRPAHAVMLAAAFILDAYAISTVSLEGLGRPLFVAVVLSLALVTILCLVLRNADLGGFAALIVVCLIIGLTIAAV